MLTRPVMAALAVGIAGNDEDLARAALGRLDPIVRGLARRKLARALIDAQLIAQGPPAHVMRLAALALAGDPIPADPEQVEAAYDQLPRWTMPRQPVWTLTTAVVSALVIGSVVFGVAASRSKVRRPHRPVAAESAQAFQRGGPPLHDAAIDELLARQLTNSIIGLNNAIKDHNSAPSVIEAIRAPAAITAHGAALAAAWRAMIEQLALAGEACARGNPTPHEVDLLQEAARDVSARMADAGLGYVIDGRLDDRFAMLQAYRVDDVVFVQIGDKPRRVLSVQRADRLNLRWAVLGMHSEGLADPIVIDERIESFVATQVFSVLAPDAVFPLGDDAWLSSPEGHPLAAACGTVVRRELADALGDDAVAAGQIATRLIERNHLIDQWTDRATRNHLVLVRTTDLFLPPHWLDQLDGFIPDYQLRHARAIEDVLGELEAPQIARRLDDLVAASVRRHEAQHGHDADRDAELRYPAPLADMLGPAIGRDGLPVPIVRAARAELSAYLTQIANDPITPQLTTWGLARHAFTPDRAGTGEMFAAYVVIEGLARQLAPDRKPTGRGRARLAPLAQSIVAATGAQLRDAARALWAELYREPIAAITP